MSGIASGVVVRERWVLETKGAAAGFMDSWIYLVTGEANINSVFCNDAG